MIADGTLVASAQGGDVRAFNELVERYQSSVYNVCLRMVGDAHLAEDCAQEAFFAAYRSIKSYRGGSFRGWLLRIAINTCYDQLRRRQRRPADSLDALRGVDPEQDSSAAQRVADPGSGPEEHSLSAETARQIQAAIDCLPPDQRLTVILCDVQGFSYDEAAQAMAVELGTVKSRLSRARAQLRELLVQKGELPASAQRLHERNP